MLNIRRCRAWIGSLLLATLGLVGCAPKTNVSATGNLPAQYSHLYMSVQEIWFHTSATAGPDDTAWIKFPLSTATTLDLASSMQGQLTALTSSVVVPIGTYAQIRLIPVDSGTTAVSSATSLGAKYNSEIDYTDSSGQPQKAPLELQNPDKGIGIVTSIQVRGGGVNILGSTSSTDSSTTNVSTTDTSNSSSSKPFSMAINVDGAKDVVPFTYGSVGGYLLNPHMTAYDTSQVGAVQGTLELADLGTLVAGQSNSSFTDIQVTAESLSTDGTRHVAVNSTPVAADGSFTLYPLATSSSSPTAYDLVIHGPSIASIIVKGVSVSVGDPSSTTPVNIGTLTPRAAASSFKVNLSTGSSTNTTAPSSTNPLNATNPLNTVNPVPAGGLVGFYQTLPGANEVPYLIEERPVDPFTLTFDSDLALPATSIDSGTFSSGSPVTLRSTDATEGAATYRVAASAPLFADGTLASAPLVNSSVTFFTLPALASASGFLGSASVAVSQRNNYDRGELIISHDGAIVATAALDTALQRGASALTIGGLPSGSGIQGTYNPALYYVSVRVWRSSDPAGSLARETFPNPLDLRTALSATYSLNID